MLALRRAAVPALLSCASLAAPGCRAYQSIVLGAGGRDLQTVRAGTPVDLRFAAPRRLAAPSREEQRRLPPNAVRVIGRVDHASTDTLFVNVSRAAPLGGRLRSVGPAVRVPVVVNRDVATKLREVSPLRTALLVLGVVAVVVLVATR